MKHDTAERPLETRALDESGKEASLLEGSVPHADINPQSRDRGRLKQRLVRPHVTANSTAAAWGAKAHVWESMGLGYSRSCRAVPQQHHHCGGLLSLSVPYGPVSAPANIYVVCTYIHTCTYVTHRGVKSQAGGCWTIGSSENFLRPKDESGRFSLKQTRNPTIFF